MFDQQIMQYLNQLYNPKKMVNGQEVTKPLDEIEQELIRTLNHDLSIVELTNKEIKSYNEIYRNYQRSHHLEVKEFNLEKTSREEYNKRIQLNERAREIYVRRVVHKGLIEHLFVNYKGLNGSVLPRKVKNLMLPNVDNMSIQEVVESIRDFKKMTSAERLTYFRNKVNTLETLINDLSKCTSDEELVNIMENRFSLINHLGEFDVDINELQNGLGITLEQADIDKLNSFKSIGAELVTMINRMNLIASPYYPKYKDMTSLADLSYELSFIEGMPRKFVAQMEAAEHLQDYKQATKHYFSTFSQLKPNAMHLGKDFQKDVMDDILKHRLQPLDAPSFKTITGIDVPSQEVSTKLLDKSYVDVYNKNQFVSRIKLNKDGFISDLEKPFKMDFKKGDSIILRARLLEMKESLAACNPKHVRFEAFIGLKNSGKYQKVVDEINKLLKTNLNKPVEVEKSFKKISDGIHDYLMEKTIDGKDKNELTYKREDAMLNAFNFFKPLAVQNAQLLEQQLNNTEKIPFLNKVQSTIITEAKENNDISVEFDDAKSTTAQYDKDLSYEI